MNRYGFDGNLDEKILEQFPEEVKTDFDFYRTYRIAINPWGVSHNPNDNFNKDPCIQAVIRDDGNR